MSAIPYIIHYGTLLGATRLGAPLPWDEDHDVFVYNVTPAELRLKLEALLSSHGFKLIPDEGGFFWVRERHWWAASGHLALEFLPPLLENSNELPIWKGGAPHLLSSELEPRVKLPLYSSFIMAPSGREALLWRLYAESGSDAAMKDFKAPRITTEAELFWRHARHPDRLDWEAISERFSNRSKWKHLLNVPWWWFNGGYIVVIGLLKKWASIHLSKADI